MTDITPSPCTSVQLALLTATPPSPHPPYTPLHLSLSLSHTHTNPAPPQVLRRRVLKAIGSSLPLSKLKKRFMKELAAAPKVTCNIDEDKTVRFG